MDVAAILKQWDSDEIIYHRIADAVVQFLKLRIKELEISPLISARTKESLSIIKKIRKKELEGRQYSYEDLSDKLGVRIICNFQSDLHKIHQFLKTHFNIINEEFKKENLRYDRLDYQSNHYDVRLNTSLAPFTELVGLEDFTFEIQVRTINQNAWADVAHSLVYKQGINLDDTVKRRMFRLIALYELADDEFNSLNDLITNMPDNLIYSLLKQIEGKFYRLAKIDFDYELSVSNLKIILAYFSEDQKQLIKNKLDDFLANNETKIEHILNENRSYFLYSPFLSQPEVFIIWFALENFEFIIKSKWADLFDYDELLDIANWWGLNVEQSY